MTTTITVNAHCDPETTEVLVIDKDRGRKDEFTVLVNGDSAEFTVHDDKSIVVYERVLSAK